MYEAADIKEIGGDPEAFLAIEATPGYQLGPGYAGDYVAPSIYRATHGYDPRRPEMHASLLLYGPNVAHGTIAGARLVDVAPTIAAWLGTRDAECRRQATGGERRRLSVLSPGQSSTMWRSRSRAASHSRRDDVERSGGLR